MLAWMVTEPFSPGHGDLGLDVKGKPGRCSRGASSKVIGCEVLRRTCVVLVHCVLAWMVTEPFSPGSATETWGSM